MNIDTSSHREVLPSESFETKTLKELDSWAFAIKSLEHPEIKNWSKLRVNTYAHTLETLGQKQTKEHQQTDSPDEFTLKILNAVDHLFPPENPKEETSAAILKTIEDIRGSLKELHIRPDGITHVKADYATLKEKVSSLLGEKAFLQNIKRRLQIPDRRKLFSLMGTLAPREEKAQIEQGRKIIALLEHGTHEDIKISFNQAHSKIKDYEKKIQTFLTHYPKKKSLIIDVFKEEIFINIEKQFDILERLIKNIKDQERKVVQRLNEHEEAFSKPINTENVGKICEEIKTRINKSKGFVLKIAEEPELIEIVDAMNEIIHALQCIFFNLNELKTDYKNELNKPTSELKIKNASTQSSKKFYDGFSGLWRKIENSIREAIKMTYVNERTLLNLGIHIKELEQNKAGTIKDFISETPEQQKNVIRDFLRKKWFPKRYLDFFWQEYLEYSGKKAEFVKYHPYLQKNKKTSPKRKKIKLVKKTTKPTKNKKAKEEDTSKQEENTIERLSSVEALEKIRKSVDLILQKSPDIN